MASEGIFHRFWAKNRDVFAPKRLLLIVLGAAILSFGMHNIHSRSGVTEGGVLGMVLFLNHQFSLPMWLMTPILDGLCYLLGLRYLGWDFLKLSVVASLGMSFFYKIWESIPYLLPDLSAYPLIAAVAGAVFVGVGVGLVIRQGSSCSGDDALALVISKVARCRIAKAYMITDFTVLALSLTYIPLRRIAFSLITVTLSSQIIDWIQRFSPLQKEESGDKSKS